MVLHNPSIGLQVLLQLTETMKRMEQAQAFDGCEKYVQKTDESSKSFEGTDRISSLPDCLLQHILSFLNVSDAVSTSVLSTNWRYLWKSISCLDFAIEDWTRETDKVTFIDTALSHYNGSKLRKLRLVCLYLDYVDSVYGYSDDSDDYSDINGDFDSDDDDDDDDDGDDDIHGDDYMHDDGDGNVDDDGDDDDDVNDDDDDDDEDDDGGDDEDDGVEDNDDVYGKEEKVAIDVQLDSWVSFAVKHNVEELVFDLYNGERVREEDWDNKLYKLPHSLYKCGSLTKLKLAYCDLNLPPSIHLSSLKKLSLELLHLSTESITSFTSFCPLLEKLTLNGCNILSNLNVNLTNQNLKFLAIYDYFTTPSQTELTISAPYLVSLKYWYILPREKYQIKKLTSLKELLISDLSDIDPRIVYCEENVCDASVGLLRDLYFVERLQLSTFLLQVMSVRAVQGIHPLYLNATCLELETDWRKRELPGISYLLKSSPKLKSLIVNIPEFKHEKEIKVSNVINEAFSFEEKDYWQFEEYDFSSALQNLEYVKIKFLSGTKKYDDINEFLKKLGHKIEFVQFLLKNAKALKKMVIKCGESLQLLSKLLVEMTKVSLTATVVFES